MGVAGSGKTTVGEAIARHYGVPFRDADEFHPQANIAKMSSGIPLNDDDRWPWLDAIGKAIRSRATLGERIGNRRGHFMPPSLLDSQLATLEKPTPDEGAITVSIEPPVDHVVAEALKALGNG
jgi:gluconate kinase